MLTLRAAALTDIGRVRRENEDRFACDLDTMLFGIADGVGGLPSGAEAADLAIHELTQAIHGGPKSQEPNLNTVVQQVNTAVANLGLRLSPNLGIGTTLTFGCIRGNAMKVAHVGDSRCYVLRGTDFIRLTEDHSVENEARLRRARGEVVYYHEANRHALTRCIGQPTRVDVDLISRVLAIGDRFLFCTDGVTRMLSERELAEAMQKHETPEATVRAVITSAIDRGGLDNATAVVVYVDEV
jgi:serine/threonine protein phosphatase PrpC